MAGHLCFSDIHSSCNWDLAFVLCTWIQSFWFLLWKPELQQKKNIPVDDDEYLLQPCKHLFTLHNNLVSDPTNQLQHKCNSKNLVFGNVW